MFQEFLLSVPDWGWLIFFTVVGLVWGSFLNVCIYRWPKEPPENNIITPRSYCPACRHTLAWKDNIPVISYLLLRGKCRYCGARIAKRYPLVELTSAFIWVFCYYFWGLSPEMFIFMLFFSLLLVGSLVDVEHRIIPDEVSVGGALLGLVISFVYPQLHGQQAHLQGLWASFLGALAGGGLVYIVGIIGELIFKKEAMGGGDVKLQAMIGAFLGWKCAILSFFLGCFVGSVIGIYQLIRYKDNTLPFGPALALGAVICLFKGEAIIGFLFPYWVYSF